VGIRKRVKKSFKSLITFRERIIGSKLPRAEILDQFWDQFLTIWRQFFKLLCGQLRGLTVWSTNGGGKVVEPSKEVVGSNLADTSIRKINDKQCDLVW